MPAEPGELYSLKVDELDGMGEPSLLVALDGYVDAGNGVQLAIDHLTSLTTVTPGKDDAAPVVVEFDADALVDYRSRRPPLTYSGGEFIAYAAPKLRITRQQDADGTPFLLLAGPEPDSQWERFCAAVIELTERLQITKTITLLAFPMAVPHTRPPSMSQHATRSDLIDDSQQPWSGAIQIPGHVGGLLEYRLGQAHRDAIGLAAHVPHYLARGDHPVTAQQLVQRIADITGLALDADGFDETVERFSTELAAEIAGNDEVAEVVRALEQQYDTFTAGSGRGLLATGEAIPSADELGAQVEAFLAEQEPK